MTPGEPLIVHPVSVRVSTDDLLPSSDTLRRAVAVAMPKVRAGVAEEAEKLADEIERGARPEITSPAQAVRLLAETMRATDAKRAAPALVVNNRGVGAQGS